MSTLSPAILASAGECTSVVTGIFNLSAMAARISHPSCTPTPRNERTEVRFALSYEALKIRSTSSFAQIFEISCAMRQTNFSDSITHGPRINGGCFSPIVALPTRKGFEFTEKQLAACAQDRQPQMAGRAR